MKGTFIANRPLVSIGMPVYNGERYLREALDSLLSQDYPNFELTISDNASEDGTEAICREYAARDSRVRYYRVERNMGAVWNFNRVFELSRGEYFMWAAFDDLRAPQYIGRCLNALEAHPNAVLCCTDVKLIDEDGQEVKESVNTYGSVESYGIKPLGSTPQQRVQALARASYWYDHYGLIRRRALVQTRLAQHVWGFDVVLMMELCLRGEVAYVPGKLFSYRVFNNKTQQDAAATLGPADGQGQRAASWSHFTLEMVRTLWLAPLRNSEKLSLTIRFLLDFCVRNSLANYSIRRDAVFSVRRAFAEGKYRIFLELLSIAALVSSAAGVNRLLASAQYRCGSIWRVCAGDGQTNTRCD